jgi:hypothetical protein
MKININKKGTRSGHRVSKCKTSQEAFGTKQSAIRNIRGSWVKQPLAAARKGLALQDSPFSVMAA